MGLFNKLKKIVKDAVEEIEQEAKLTEKHGFSVTGTKYNQDNIKSVLKRNANYDLTKVQLKKIEGCVYEYEQITTFKDVQVVEEPDNEYDPNAVKVLYKGVCVGYIKKGITSRVKNLLKKPNKIELHLYGGNYKGWDVDGYNGDREVKTFMSEKGDIKCKISIYTEPIE